MTAAKYDLLLERGSNESKVFTYKDSTGTAINLTGYTGETIFLDKPGGSVLLTIAPTLGGSAGTITHSFSLAQIAALPNKGVFRIKITTGGITKRIVQGSFYIDPE